MQCCLDKYNKHYGIYGPPYLPYSVQSFVWRINDNHMLIFPYSPSKLHVALETTSTDGVPKTSYCWTSCESKVGSSWMGHNKVNENIDKMMIKKKIQAPLLKRRRWWRVLKQRWLQQNIILKCHCNGIKGYCSTQHFGGKSLTTFTKGQINLRSRIFRQH